MELCMRWKLTKLWSDTTDETILRYKLTNYMSAIEYTGQIQLTKKIMWLQAILRFMTHKVLSQAKESRRAYTYWLGRNTNQKYQAKLSQTLHSLGLVTRKQKFVEEKYTAHFHHLRTSVRKWKRISRKADLNKRRTLYINTPYVCVSAHSRALGPMATPS